MVPDEFITVRRRNGSTPARRIVVAFAVLVACALPLHAASGDDEGFAIRSGTGMLRSTLPRRAGKVPVVFIHGMLGTPRLWSAMIERLGVEPPIAERFQLLTFGYDSLQPIADSARELREALAEARRRFDPEGRDASFERIVLVGHSLGGLVAKAAAPHETPRPVATPRVGRLVFVATPHRGTPVDQGVLRSVGAGLARVVSPSLAARRRCATRAAGAVTSVDELTADHPLLSELERARASAGLPFHSIIAALGDADAAGATDGLVPVSSARLAGARSELVVHAPHLCHRDADVIREVQRVLVEQADEALHLAESGRPDPRTDPASAHPATIPAF